MKVNELKKLLAVILSLVLIFGILPTGVVADTEENWKEFLLEKLWDVETETIDVSEYNVTFDEIAAFLSYDIYYHYPEVEYYFDWISDAYSDGDTNYALRFKFTYRYDKATIKEMQNNIETVIEPVLDGVKKSWSDFETALYLHDWLCTNFMYDLNLWSNPGEENYDMHSFLMEKEGVCQAYALTYLYLLRRCDIDSYFVMSTEDGHGWNVVKIDGSWYHIDATHDDPVMNKNGSVDAWGKANHDHFMLSDAELEDCCKMHSDWVDPLGAIKSCDSSVKNAYWKDISTSIIEIDDWWYYIDYSRGGLVKTKDFVNIQRVVEIGEEFDDKYHWMVTENSGYPAYYTGLYELNEHLFFTDSTTIYCYDTHFGRLSKVYELNENNPERFYGIYMHGKDIEYIISTNAEYY